MRNRGVRGQAALVVVALLAGCSSDEGNISAPAVDASVDLAWDAPGAADASSDAARGDAAVDVAADTVDEAEASDDGSDAAPAVDATATTDAGDACDATAIVGTPLDPAAEGLPASGLALWLRADRGIYEAGASGVCAWRDARLNATLLGRGAGPDPTWVAASIGGRPAVEFTASTAGFSVAGVLGIAPTSGRTFVAVGELESAATRWTIVGQGATGSAGTYLTIDTNTFQTAGSREGVYAMNNAYDSTLATAVTPRLHVYTIQQMTVGAPVLDALGYRVNGVDLTLSRNGGGLGNGLLESFAAADVTWAGASVPSRLAEVLIYDRPLSAGEIATLETTLEARYGIP